MAIFSDDPDALEIVLNVPLLQFGGATMGGAGFLSMSAVVFGSVLFGGQGHVRFPTNEKVDCTVLVDDDSLLSVLVDDDSLLSVQVLEDARPGAAAVFAVPLFGSVTLRGQGALDVLYDTVTFRGAGHLQIATLAGETHTVVVDDDSLLALLVDDVPVFTVQVLED